MYLCDLHFKYIIININRGIHFEGLWKYDHYLQCDLVPVIKSCHCKVIQLMENYIESNLTLIFLKDYRDYMWFKNMWGNTNCSIYRITSYPHVLQGKNMNLTIPIWEPNSWTLVDTWTSMGNSNSQLSFIQSYWMTPMHPSPFSSITHVDVGAPERCCTII
jgi:hypothetical protein